MPTRIVRRPSRFRPGFTLIELLIVVVIIGILAAVAIPKFATVRGRAGKGTMTADLRQLALAQEGFYASRDAYTSDMSLLEYKNSSGITITIHEATANGWSASATRPSLTLSTCALYYGDAKAIAPAVAVGAIKCD